MLKLAGGLYKYKPYYSEGYNRLIYLIAGMNVINYLLILPFNYEIQLSVYVSLHLFLGLCLSL